MYDTTITATPQHQVRNAIGFPREVLDTSIKARFEEVAALVPNRIALHGIRDIVTYSELNVRANVIANNILDVMGSGSVPVPVLVDFEPDTMINLVAVIKSGHPYVALHPDFPTARLKDTIDTLGSPIILAAKGTLVRAQELCALSPACALLHPTDVGPQSQRENPDVSVKSTDPTAIFFTTGTTGRPKGVERSQAMMLQRVWQDDQEHHYAITTQVSGLYSAAFSGSASDIWGALLNGATLHPLDPRQMSFDQFMTWIDERAINFFHPPVNYLRSMLEVIPPDHQFASVERCLLSGQGLFTSDVKKLWPHLRQDCQLIHTIASSETSTMAFMPLTRETPLPDRIVPVGRAAVDKKILILDPDGTPLPPGETGQIAVQSAYLATGYWQDPQQTAAKFLAIADSAERLYLTGDLGSVDADGLLQHLGRMDHQVKVRGYRVDLRYLEAVIQEVPGVAASVVVADNSQDDVMLIGYIEGKDGANELAERVREALQEELPSYMVPHHLVEIPSLPRSENGKIDRKRLPAIATLDSDRVIVAPRTPLESALAEIWQRILKVPEIDVTLSFVAMGGDSIKAMRIANEVIHTFDVDMAPGDLFSAQNIESMAILVRDELLRTLSISTEDPIWDGL